MCPLTIHVAKRITQIRKYAENELINVSLVMVYVQKKQPLDAKWNTDAIVSRKGE